MSEILYLHHPSSLEHETGSHPERAERIVAIERELERRGWEGCRREPAPHVDRALLEKVHPPAYIDSIARASRARTAECSTRTRSCRRGPGRRRCTPPEAPRGRSRRCWAGRPRIGFCGLRPPGHHAEPDQAMGFCLFNNAAVAAMHALDDHGAERVLVLDWDVHHGNGTNDIFRGTDRVLYSSIHQSPLYPGTGPMTDNGTGAGEGFTVNLPVPARHGTRRVARARAARGRADRADVRAAARDRVRRLRRAP